MSGDRSFQRILPSVALSLLLALFGSACSDSSDDDDGDNGGGSGNQTDACDAIGAKIINGDRCQVGPEVSVARLTIRSSRGEIALCTGSVIDRNAILTAGHCFTGFTVQRVEIDVGLESTTASRIVVHPDYAEDFRVGAVFNDVAVVFTRNDLDVPRLPILASRSPRVGEEGVVTGFGTTEDGDLGQLFAGNAEITDISSNHIFTAFDGSGSNPCTGDSGGPILVDAGGALAIAGVVSSGNPEFVDCSAGDVTLYANLDNAGISSFVLGQVPGAGTR